MGLECMMWNPQKISKSKIKNTKNTITLIHGKSKQFHTELKRCALFIE